ncbi:hypothetical protein A9Q84_11040 [Halobacteriovorax marinus]|uniref:Uncharacterized protein n=1 Tax=Halobacteriovorax marinus TaxID=97084 RepID=A0A1Y5F7W0_9BACT|nr:hypothetical protein A9Q84_11040 [Halobacteriovorax marinus]
MTTNTGQTYEISGLDLAIIESKYEFQPRMVNEAKLEDKVYRDFALPNINNHVVNYCHGKFTPRQF